MNANVQSNLKSLKSDNFVGNDSVFPFDAKHQKSGIIREECRDEISPAKMEDELETLKQIEAESAAQAVNGNLARQFLEFLRENCPLRSILFSEDGNFCKDDPKLSELFEPQAQRLNSMLCRWLEDAKIPPKSETFSLWLEFGRANSSPATDLLKSSIEELKNSESLSSHLNKQREWADDESENVGRMGRMGGGGGLLDGNNKASKSVQSLNAFPPHLLLTSIYEHLLLAEERVEKMDKLPQTTLLRTLVHNLELLGTLFDAEWNRFWANDETNKETI